MSQRRERDGLEGPCGLSDQVKEDICLVLALFSPVLMSCIFNRKLEVIVD